MLVIRQVSHIECVTQAEAQEFVEDDQAHNWMLYCFSSRDFCMHHWQGFLLVAKKNKSSEYKGVVEMIEQGCGRIAFTDGGVSLQSVNWLKLTVARKLRRRMSTSRLTVCNCILVDIGIVHCSFVYRVFVWTWRQVAVHNPVRYKKPVLILEYCYCRF